MAQGITATSTGFSTAIDLNPSAKETTMLLVVTAGASGNTTIQVTLDDLTPGTSQATSWGALSSAINSSGIDGLGTSYTILSPISGVRLLTQTSTTTGVVGTASLRVIQSVTA